MAKVDRAHRRRQRRQVQTHNTTTPFLILGGVVLIVVVVFGVAILVGRQSATSTESLPEVAVSTKPIPPNAEQNGRAWGPKDAPIKVEEFLDYQCPACQEYALTHEPSVIAAFAGTGKVRYEINNFQFKGYDSVNAAKGAYCAAEQNAFWRMHSTIFMNQSPNHMPGAFSDRRLISMAKELGLDTAAFEQCLVSKKYEQQVQADYERAVALNIQSTPTFVINGKLYPGVHTLDDLKRIFAEIAPEVTFDR